MVIIKRYANRKLYNTKEKKYITLDGIRNLIKAGEEISIIDHENGADLTAVTLAQIIFEQEKKGDGKLPKTIFTRLIQAGEDTLHSLKTTIGNPIDFAKQVNQELEHRIRTLINQNEISVEEGTRFIQKLSSLGHRLTIETELDSIRNYLVNQYDIITREDIETLKNQLDILAEAVEGLEGSFE